MYARRFLWVIAILIMLVIAAAIGYRLFGAALLRVATVPHGSFAASPVASPPDYRHVSGWLAQPRLDSAARWTPPGDHAAAEPRAVVFFVPGSAYFGNDRWTMPLSDAVSDARDRGFLKNEASVFNGVADVWSPRYRQASFGATLTDSADARAALAFAYADVLRAWEVFVAQVPPDAPIVVAGHEQGAAHLLRLLQTRVAGTALAPRIAAAYLIGWPLAAADLAATGLPACRAPGDARCTVAYVSFADPVETAPLRARFEAGGAKRRGVAIACTNPLTGGASPSAAAAANRGTLLPDKSTLVARAVGARCLPDGVLAIGAPPMLGGFVRPGGDYGYYDYPLFWSNLRADAAARVAAVAETPGR